MWRISSLQTRGAEAARAGDIDRGAPVHARASIDLPCEADVAWGALADVAAWPQFLPGVSRARITGPTTPKGDRLDASSRFVWVNGGIPVRSRVEVAEPGRELTWTGVALWLVAVHRNSIQPISTGCRMISEESMAGVGAARAMPADKLQRELEVFVRSVGDEAIRRCR